MTTEERSAGCLQAKEPQECRPAQGRWARQEHPPSESPREPAPPRLHWGLLASRVTLQSGCQLQFLSGVAAGQGSEEDREWSPWLSKQGQQGTCTLANPGAPPPLRLLSPQPPSPLSLQLLQELEQSSPHPARFRGGCCVVETGAVRGLPAALPASHWQGWGASRCADPGVPPHLHALASLRGPCWDVHTARPCWPSGHRRGPGFCLARAGSLDSFCPVAYVPLWCILEKEVHGILGGLFPAPPVDTTPV